MEISIRFFDVKKFQPPNKANVIAIVKDLVTGKEMIESSFFEDGVFWNDASSQAQGIERSSQDYNNVYSYDYKVIAWAPSEINKGE